ncbi:aminomethyl-transferring glycine dehydrogenase [Aridibaculum aurantiacum]|uniref:aminomethyl-transferring glycine dehydrogenase n=1 Tax=Aridibaculum aurantiacum TaxID=2810307 RepID=UPI001A963823|nr:aminomethyl-transferring glycine dehydrogenase [Aridibaculum aurantiacum]
MNIFEQQANEFQERHIGPNEQDTQQMLQTIGASSLEELINRTVPEAIRLPDPLDVAGPVSEARYLAELRETAQKNKVFKSYIGQGYYDNFTPSVIRRNLFENPGWYTQYTPYQAEIAQGRLESLLNFQTMISDLTALPIANASLLDEGTAAAEAMAMLFNNKNKGENIGAPKFFVDAKVFVQTLDVVITRATPLKIEVVVGDFKTAELDETYFGALLQYPNSDGAVEDYRSFTEKAHAANVLVIMAADLLALTLLTPPGELGADVAIGSAQRFGVPMGFGGPHAAFFATKDEFKRVIPGRIIGVSIDAQGTRALRMALQTREQHIRREKATSNICTAQALLANMAAMYAVYHGPEGLKNIGKRVSLLAFALANELAAMGFEQANQYFFDTIKIKVDDIDALRLEAEARSINFYYGNEGYVGISLDETTTQEDILDILQVFAEVAGIESVSLSFDYDSNLENIPTSLTRTSTYLGHPVFNTHHSETEMMRYLKMLENKDLSLDNSMIPLGSCTMKLNAATELIPVSWPQFSKMHPFAPKDQWEGYQQIVHELEAWLSNITGFAATSLQPNSGAQGEYAGLLAIKAYHEDRKEAHRNVILIPISAHGTNPASAVMAGLKVVVTKCDEAGNIDVEDLRRNAEKYKDSLAGLMVTYPSTHGVFEESIKEICDIIHEFGGLVYMDGANMNAQVGLTAPGYIGADVCHLNLHKTFAIPHGGGGPGMGPICVNEKLAPFLPGHVSINKDAQANAVSAAPFGSASILLISYAYIKMLGANGLRKATEYAILNANYMKAKLEKHYKILYSGKNNTCAHEFIVDLRPFKAVGIEAEDVAKRLMDYGFHAPTLSFPVAGTIMIEPTESEPKEELDRFCEAMINIHEEIVAIENGTADKTDNVLKNAPHPQQVICADEWNHAYPRSQAAFPLPFVREKKFWPSISRINNTHGDRNLICTCEPIEAYQEAGVN